MKKITIAFLLLSLAFTTLAQKTSPDDNLSEELAPLLSNYLEDYQARFEAVHLFPISTEESKTNPVLLIPVTSLKASSLQDCEENPSSLVCQIVKAVEAYVRTHAVTKGKINLNITIYQKTKVIKEIKDVEVLTF